VGTLEFIQLRHSPKRAILAAPDRVNTGSLRSGFYFVVQCATVVAEGGGLLPSKCAGEKMPRSGKKISKKEFVRGFAAEALKYLESLPAGERNARLEAFGKKVLRSCARESEPTKPTASQTRAIPLAAREHESR